MSSIARKMEAAIAAAHCSPGVGGRNKSYRIGAALYNKNRLITAKFNSYKTNPHAMKYYGYPHIHAEFSAIIHAGLDNCHGLTIFVARVRRDNSIGEAKPCHGCLRLIKEVGIKEIVYTTDDGNWQVQKVM